MNPEPDKAINMGKANCIKEAKRQLALRKRPRKRALTPNAGDTS